MLHLVFSDNGLQKIKDVMRPSDQVVQLSKDRILLLDVDKFLGADPQIDGEIIDPARLANIINNATSIKSTY